MTPNHKPTYRVAIALVHRDGQWLVARRHDDAHLGGLWEFPGGKCEANETIEQAAVRELREECGIEARVERVLPSVRCEYADRVIDLAPVICRWVAGEAHPLGSQECRWVVAGELVRLEMPAVNVGIVRSALGA